MSRSSSFLSDFYPESRFGGFSAVDGTIAFYTRVNALLTSDAVVVDFGCGRGAHGDDPIPHRRALRILRGKARRVIGLDVDPNASANPFIDEFHLLQGPAWPLESETADIVVCDNVLEHLPDPRIFFSETNRALKPGGVLCLRTPNAWNYVAVLSRLVPNRAHAGILTRAKPGTPERDIFPTLYRCNTLPAVRRMLREHGLDGVVIGCEAEPSYLAFSRLAYALGVAHQRVAPGFLRAAILAFARKQPIR